MAHGHTVTAVAALHPVFSSPDTAAHVSEAGQWPETAEVGVPEVGGAAAASSPYSILSGGPCGQIAPGLSVSCVTHAGRICGRSLNAGHLEEDLGVYLEAARLQKAAPARSPPSPGPRRADVARSSRRHALPRRHSEVGADIDFRQPRIWTE